MDFAEEIALLQAERQKEIALLHFDKSEELEQSIKTLRRNTDRSKLSIRKAQSSRLFEQEQQQVLTSAHITAVSLTEEIYSARSKHESDLVAVRARQAQELS
jgi:UTP-glucose-1-phosphate uridylyltransferase